MDLRFNAVAPFTQWAVKSAVLAESFVLIDIGVQGGESPRWHLLGDYLVVHGFDAIREVITELREQNRDYPNRHYHWLAAGATDGECSFYFNATDPCSSSVYSQGPDRFALQERRDELRTVTVRRLDGLLDEGVIPQADFIKCDVEGYEQQVFRGAPGLLRSALGVECETNFNISPIYPKSHYVAIQELLLEANLLTFDLNFNRIPRASFVRAASRNGCGDPAAMRDCGKPATLNVLFCSDPIAEADQPENYTAPGQPAGVDQLIKIMIICEIYGLSDIAVDIAERFAERLSPRMDIEKAIDLLVDIPAWQNQSTPTEKIAAATPHAELGAIPARALGAELLGRAHRRFGHVFRPSAV